ncbi:tetratricopeptide repeat protein [Desulfolutivibrio sulfoxidireducens]|uniref:tetratricopeptide repeat protein n=1 Tax=Desulfolutivibrio sulfoxidireducens TaxID=2773299 RepID=UPI00159DF865|nr:tetratricopeptide repeat protein [Desulfolutivibrio sulfoxidireducens]QLA16913.1 tetratricopeptide repeat protein [Desulfolutivibrio sulfoxidireducens]
MQRSHTFFLTLFLSLVIPVTAAALSKDEVRERSLKRLRQTGETIRTEGRQAEDGSPRFGRPPQEPEDEVHKPASPGSAGAGTAQPRGIGRTWERGQDQAVIVPVPASPPGSGPVFSPASPTPSRPAPETPGKSATAPAGVRPAAPTPSPAEREKALVLFRQALSAAGRNDHQKALELLNMATVLDPTDPDLFNNRGNTLNNLGNPKKALEDYNTAVSLKPNDPAYLCNRGVAFERLGDDQAACRDYRGACDLGDCGFYNSFKKEGRCPNP